MKSFDFNKEQREIVHLIESLSETSKTSGQGKRFSWNTFNGNMTCNVVKNYLKRHLMNSLKVVGPAFIRGFPVEFDLLVVGKKSQCEAFTDAYDGKSVRAIIEVKSHGTYSQDALRRIKAIFDRLANNYHVKCIYLTIRESGQPKRKSSKNWIKITRDILSPHYVFVLCDSRTKEYYPDQWGKFIETANSV